MRIVIEFDTTDGRATVTTEPDSRGAGTTPGMVAGALGSADATDAGPPADGAPIPGRVAAAGGEAVDAGPAPAAADAGALVASEEGSVEGGHTGGGQVDAGRAPDLG